MSRARWPSASLNRQPPSRFCLTHQQVRQQPGHPADAGRPCAEVTGLGGRRPAPGRAGNEGCRGGNGPRPPATSPGRPACSARRALPRRRRARVACQRATRVLAPAPVTRIAACVVAGQRASPGRHRQRFPTARRTLPSRRSDAAAAAPCRLWLPLRSGASVCPPTQRSCPPSPLCRMPGRPSITSPAPLTSRGSSASEGETARHG